MLAIGGRVGSSPDLGVDPGIGRTAQQVQPVADRGRMGSQEVADLCLVALPPCGRVEARCRLMAARREPLDTGPQEPLQLAELEAGGSTAEARQPVRPAAILGLERLDQAAPLSRARAP